MTNKTGTSGHRKKIKLLPLIILIALSFAFVVAIRQMNADGMLETTRPPQVQATPVPGSVDAVAAYIREKGELPDYYITKQEAGKLGWSGGSLEPYAPGKLIGGDRFGNYEGLLPKKAGRTWTECDIDTFGEKSRGAKRIVFSSDGLIYYTDDHYASFTELKEAK